MVLPDLIHIVQSEGISLKRRGTVLQGLCPFHAEKTPSFAVHTNTHDGKPRFYCHSCQAQGDVIDFVRQLRSLSYRAALAYLGLSNVRDYTSTEARERAAKAAAERERRRKAEEARQARINQLADWLWRIDRLAMSIRTEEEMSEMAELYHIMPRLEEEYWQLTGLKI